MTDYHAEKYAAALAFAERQVAATIERTGDYFPIYTSGGKWHHGGELWTDWTGGFFAGMMWQFFRRTGNPQWRERAEHYSRLLEQRQHDRDVHDLGFIFLNTYRPWHELTGDAPCATCSSRPAARWPCDFKSEASTCARSSGRSRCLSIS